MSSENAQECSNIIQDTTRGEYICADTGEVISDHMILELPSYQNQQIYHTVRKNKLMEIKFRRLIATDKRTKLSSYLIKKMSIIFNRYASMLSLPKNVRLEAWKLINKAYVLNYKKKNKDSFVLACIYIACNKYNYPVDLHTLKQYDSKAVKEIYKNIKMITRYLKISLKPTNPTNLIPSLVYDLNLPDTLIHKSVQLLTEFSRNSVLTRSRYAYAVASVYIIAMLLGYKIKQSDIRRKTGVGEITLRNAAKDILNNMDSIEFICSKCNNVVERVTTYKQFIPTVNLLYNYRPLCKYCERYFSMTDISIEVKDKKIIVKL
jgi:transcription initiation factor TFIIB